LPFENFQLRDLFVAGKEEFPTCFLFVNLYGFETSLRLAIGCIFVLVRL